ncbi:uncharacterized protein Dana_GF20922 [Drosophila ananassae]|uniref:HMG box domain-containing protein n=1 Tax=Drosophila ananassae TaxID=7217 RepID=B3MRV9_DROAN|nr:uncharacterized protein Dana_GF20922 [Drosophila ananassae]
MGQRSATNLHPYWCVICSRISSSRCDKQKKTNKIQDMIGGQQAAAQVTPAGAAIKLHFACNKTNNNNNNNIVNNNNNNTNNNNNNSNINNANNNNNNNNGEQSTSVSLGTWTSTASPLGAIRAVTIKATAKGIGSAAQTLKGFPSRSGAMLGVNRGSTVGIVTGLPAAISVGARGLRLLPAPIPLAKGKPSTTLVAGGGDSAVAIMSVEKAGEAPAPTKSALVTTFSSQPSAGAQQQPTQRTEDQENAFRRIEDVHNYAKLQDYSSEDYDVEDEEEEEEEEELDEEEEEEDDDDDEAAVAGVKIQVQALPHTKPEVTRIRREDTEEHVDVDVVTVPQPEQESDQEKHHKEAVEIIQPEHHARRPMNAFLIFCKRHRAIVKERYKTLENRAITKILGDWWAALDEQEKHCFTDLAQQNKDAFFNANPNFKWYKLPAPPLRTLATRPSNAAAGGVGPSGDDNQPQPPHPTQLQLQKIPLDLLRNNYFKLADETQMGELSSLLQVQVQEKDYALQQVLSETSQFLSAHMPGATGNQPASAGLKRSFDSQSSNSSEEEGATGSPNKKAKSSRSCKGKIYQELVNSGQLAAINKKGKNRNPTVSGNFTDTSLDAAPNTPPISPPERPQSSRHQRSVSESSSSGFFNLEERIKELPALSLDAYLQRKRSTKKKKKFSGSRKQRSISSSGARAGHSDPAVGAGDLERIKQQQLQQQQLLQKQQQRQQAAAVGSQRRKARKESITRRDVSAIEQEVASILPLTINGCYYFNESPVPKATSGPVSIVASNSSSPLSSNSSSFSSPNLEETSSTSDLLILAEVAANRTELTKSN